HSPPSPTRRSSDLFQPVWHEDLAQALVECVERPDVAGRTLNLAGPEVITVRDVLDLFSTVTDRSPLRVPLPAFLAKVGSAVASAVGVETPVSAATVQMLLEGNFLRDDENNDLTDTLGVATLPMRDRLVQLADALPEQTPDQGVGPLKRRRFEIDIAGSGTTASALFDRFRREFATVVPFEAAAEPGTPTRVEENTTLTLGLPARGHVQVRVEHIDDNVIMLATLEGHPLAGVVRFRCEDREPGHVRFTIDVIERAASRVDQLSMALVGTAAQKRVWKQTAENVSRLAGVEPGEVEEQSWNLDDEQAEPLEDWISGIVRRRRRTTENHVGAGG